MIHLVTAENRHLYQKEMQDQFRVRHEIYVEERGWDALRRPDRLEHDAFDTDDAAYLLAIENDRVVGGSRFTPTTKPHLLSEVFPHMAEVKGIPRAPDIMEWTRMYVIKEARGTMQGNGTLGQLWSGAIEYCLTEGLSAFTFIFEVWHFTRMHECRWKLRPLGLPAIIENNMWLAALVEIDEEVLHGTRRFCGVPGPVLVRHGIAARDRIRLAS